MASRTGTSNPVANLEIEPEHREHRDGSSLDRASALREVWARPKELGRKQSVEVEEESDGCSSTIGIDDAAAPGTFEELTEEVMARSNYAELEDRDNAAILSVMDWINYTVECTVAADKHMRFYILMVISLLGMLILASIWTSVKHGEDVQGPTANEFGDAVWMTFLVLIAGEFTTDVRGPPL